MARLEDFDPEGRDGEVRTVAVLTSHERLPAKMIPYFVFISVFLVLSPTSLPMGFVDGVASMSAPILSDPYPSWTLSIVVNGGSPADPQTTATSEIVLDSERLDSGRTEEHELDFERKRRFATAHARYWQSSYLLGPVLAESEHVNSLTPLISLPRSEGVVDRFWASLMSVLSALATGGLGRGSDFPFKLRRRTRMDVIAEILRISVTGVRKTRIIQSANLNSRIVEDYLLDLERAKLLQRITHSPTIFVTTIKGQLFLLSYRRMKKLLAPEEEAQEADRNTFRMKRNDPFNEDENC